MSYNDSGNIINQVEFNRGPKWNYEKRTRGDSEN